MLTTCIATARGVWAARAGEGSLPSLIHYDAHGTIAEVALPSAPNASNCNEADAAIIMKPAADYDGDGEAEVYVGVSQTGPHQAQCEAHAIFSFHDGTIEPVTVLGRMVGLTDADHDGLDDPLVEIFVSEYDDCAGYAHRDSGPPLLAHALPDGSFSTDDAVAREFARRSCRVKPVATAYATDVVCSRLWGASVAAVLAAVGRAEAECRATVGQPSDSDGCGGAACARQRDEGFARAELRWSLAP